MGLIGKLVDQIEIKAVGDLFHESFSYKPHSLSSITPELVHGCDLHEGDFGTVGSVITWHFTYDGKKTYAKEIVEVIDDEKKSIVMKLIEGELLDSFKYFITTYHVDDTGDDNHLVTWTFDYEKVNENIPDPISLMKFCLDVTKDIAAHHEATPRLVVHP